MDAGPGQYRVLGSSLVHMVDAVCRSDSSTGSPRPIHGSLGDGDGGYRVDVAAGLHCWWTVDVDLATSLQPEAAASMFVSLMSWRRLGVMLLLLSRRLSLVPATVNVARSDARVLARPACCHVAGGLWTLMPLSPPSVQLPQMTASPHCPGVVFVRWC